MRRLLDLLFPPRCLSCARPGSFLCAPCSAAIGRAPGACCPACRQSVAWDDPCCRCADPQPAALIALGTYAGTLRDAVHSFKYKGQRAGAPALAALLAQTLGAVLQPGDLLAPIPLHPARERARGYNQSRELARALAPLLGVRAEDAALRRVRATAEQRTLGRAARARNVRGAFVADPARCAGRTIVLIDDVCTTGVTLREAAEALRAAGATRVYAAALALTMPGRVD